MSEKYYGDLMDVFEQIDTRQVASNTVCTVIYEDAGCERCSHTPDGWMHGGGRGYCWTSVRVSELTQGH